MPFKHHCRGVARRPLLVAILVLLVGAALCLPDLLAETITLNNGMQYRGKVAKISSVNENPLAAARPAGNVDVSKVVMVDDDLRRVFFSSNNWRNEAPDDAMAMERVRIDKRVAVNASRSVGSVGPILRVDPFDEHGNRIFTMNTAQGPLDVIQGITEITPTYTKVEGLLVKNAITWDMRIATSTIPRETLSRILHNQIDLKDARQRLRIVTLYIQAERYRDALIELEQTIADFPDLKDLPKQRDRLLQLVAEDVLREIELRREAGQHLHAFTLLKSFPGQDVAGETLLKVGDLVKEYERIQDQGKTALTLMEGHYEQLKDHPDAELLKTICGEIAVQMNIHTLNRMADYLRLADDPKMKVDQKLSLAISGWLLGSGNATQNLAEAVSMVQVRDAAIEYMRVETQVERDQILGQMQSLEGSAPATLVKILANMRPPLDTEFPEAGVPGMVELSVPGIGDQPEFRYLVQLPPEYDPYRRYPCIVTLHGAGSTAEQQVDWWAGGFDPQRQMRLGQASRHGYIVIAPRWAEDFQNRYEYSAREHAVVLRSLRDAMRRFSMDTDRVYLSGHSMGGDAVWDIGLSHPDLWAGVIPVAAKADKYVSRYWENGRGLPMYFVAGELDGNKIADNARDLDRYFKYSGFDVIYVEYLGRGHEHFQDEIQQLFDWMSKQRRDFFPGEFETVTMRPWDNFFWWVEFRGFPERSLVLPANWPQSNVRTATNSCQVLPSNGILVRSAASDLTVWLCPEIIDFDKRIEINGDRVEVVPSTQVVLEDVRSRGDRQHPFWARVDVQNGRRR